MASDAALVKSRPFWLALSLNVVLFLVTLAIGIRSHSLTLVSNAFHLLSDLAGLAISIAATWLSNRPASLRHSFGLVRAEVLGAMTVTLLLIGASVLITFDALRRIFSGSSAFISHSAGVDLGIAGGIGLGVTVISVVVFARGDMRSALVKANLLHYAADGVGWILAVVAGLLIARFHFSLADPIASVVVSLLVIVGSARVLKEVADVLLDASPSRVDIDQIRRALLANSEVQDVHHLHVWNLSSTAIALSAHLVMVDGITLHQAQDYSHSIKKSLEQDFSITHATLELECHLCDSPTHMLES